MIPCKSTDSRVEASNHALPGNMLMNTLAPYSRSMISELSISLAFVLCINSSAAQAQTKRETINFIFATPKSILIPGTSFSNDEQFRSVEENGCVVTLSSKMNDDSRPEIKGTPISAEIDFNSLIMNAAKIQDGSVLNHPISFEVKIPSDTDAVKVHYFDYSTYTGKGIVSEERHSYRNLDMNVFSSDNIVRIKNAFHYFTTTYCTGKRSAF